ncbi:transporter [Roseateles violae]|uniref:Transporter n=1 Tax=Roseateles violae TaxID=3058042 RepID=A0ABT8DX38_9BURK|nr:transporter [Pelomonas sp. PFR6]MDN3921823.1 transporter [Pelomonas sp. PFR6]
MKSIQCVTVVTGLALLLQAGPARAEEALVTDRPDFVESSDVVGRGRLQLETSLAGERSTANGVHVKGLATPTLLRLGVAEDWELRLETEGWRRETSSGGGASEQGFADLALGAKWHWRDGDAERGLPGLAWLLHVDLASGSAAFRGAGTRPSLRLSAEWDLPAGYNLGLMPGLYHDHNEAGHGFVGGILALSLGRQFSAALHAFVELAGQQLAADKNGGQQISFDTGLSYLLGDSLQIDAAIFCGLNKRTPQLQWTAGVSKRF